MRYERGPAAEFWLNTKTGAALLILGVLAVGFLLGLGWMLVALTAVVAVAVWDSDGRRWAGAAFVVVGTAGIALYLKFC